MIKLLLLLMIACIFGYQPKALAVNLSTSTSKTVNKTPISTANKSTLNKDKKLSTQVDFNDHLVGGTYQKPLEALTVVEDDKSLESLIGMRKNFKDREKKMKELK